MKSDLKKFDELQIELEKITITDAKCAPSSIAWGITTRIITSPFTGTTRKQVSVLAASLSVWSGRSVPTICAASSASI